MFLDGAPDADTPGEFGLQRALSRIRADERRGHRQRRTRLLAAAAVLLLVVGGGSALLGRASVPDVIVAAPVPAVEQPAGRLVSGSNGQIGAAAVVTPAAGWVRIAVTATGLPSGERCSVVVVARDGTEAIAATWVVPPVPTRVARRSTARQASATRTWRPSPFAARQARRWCRCRSNCPTRPGLAARCATPMPATMKTADHRSTGAECRLLAALCLTFEQDEVVHQLLHAGAGLRHQVLGRRIVHPRGGRAGLSARRDSDRASRSSAVTTFAEGRSGRSSSSSLTPSIVLPATSPRTGPTSDRRAVGIAERDGSARVVMSCWPPPRGGMNRLSFSGGFREIIVVEAPVVQ